jgi:hypothetical protein
MHADGLRMGGLLLDTPYVLLAGRLPLPKWLPEGVQLSIETMGACMLRDARPGIWIAGMCSHPTVFFSSCYYSSTSVNSLTPHCSLPLLDAADRHLVRCPVCNVNKCSGMLVDAEQYVLRSALVTEFGWNGLGRAGTVQVLDVRHCELFLEKEYCNGTWEFEDLGEHFMDEEAAAACCAVFNRSCLDSIYAHCTAI